MPPAPFSRAPEIPLMRPRGVSCTATCTLMETNGSGFHTSSTGYWEAETDGACLHVQRSAVRSCVQAARTCALVQRMVELGLRRVLSVQALSL